MENLYLYLVGDKRKHGFFKRILDTMNVIVCMMVVKRYGENIKCTQRVHHHTKGMGSITTAVAA